MFGQKRVILPYLLLLKNELNGDDAKNLIANGCVAVSEGANIPSTPEAIEVFKKAKSLCSGKSSQCGGGVATSGLEMTQNSIEWTLVKRSGQKIKRYYERYSRKLREIWKQKPMAMSTMKGSQYRWIMKVAKAMMAQVLSKKLFIFVFDVALFIGLHQYQ